MKNFWSTRLMDMTIGQSILYILGITFVSVVVTVLALMIPQAAEELFDWCEEKATKFKRWLRKEDRLA